MLLLARDRNLTIGSAVVLNGIAVLTVLAEAALRLHRLNHDRGEPPGDVPPAEAEVHGGQRHQLGIYEADAGLHIPRWCVVNVGPLRAGCFGSCGRGWLYRTSA